MFILHDERKSAHDKTPPSTETGIQAAEYKKKIGSCQWISNFGPHKLAPQADVECRP
jgi:hypothetical protein